MIIISIAIHLQKRYTFQMMLSVHRNVTIENSIFFSQSINILDSINIRKVFIEFVMCVEWVQTWMTMTLYSIWMELRNIICENIFIYYSKLGILYYHIKYQKWFPISMKFENADPSIVYRASARIGFSNRDIIFICLTCKQAVAFHRIEYARIQMLIFDRWHDEILAQILNNFE